MAFRLPILVFVGLFFSISAASSARADTIPVTSGELTIAWDDPSSFVLFGPGGFALSGLFIRIPSSPQGTCFTGCTPGQVINLSSVAGGGSGFTLGESFTANVNGVVARTDQPDTWLGLTGLFRFDSSDVVAPPLTGTSERVFLTAPFVFQGQVAGFPRDGSEAQMPLFQVNLAGRGTDRLGLTDFGDGVYRVPEAVYTFEAPNPVPEPTAILLLGTGLARVLFTRRRKTPA